MGGGTVDWENLSTGLPNLPINCIEVYKDSEWEEMFAGTDCGVYYYNNIIGHWTKYGNGMPVCAVSDLEINYKTNQLVASTFGRGMYMAELCEIGPSESNIYVTDTQIWEGSKRIPADIIIQPGGDLTIKGDVFMKYNKSIMVHVGAFLTVDGGKVTSHCSTQPWAGIRVLGTSSEGQNPLYQGVVLLKNNAIIENAKIGVHCYNLTDPSDSYPMTGGGILLASNSTFRNNMVSVQFERYTSHFVISSFKNCSFLADAHMSISMPLKYFLRLNEISNLVILGCDFKNISLTSGEDANARGIESFNSSFVMDMMCNTTPPCAEIDMDKSTFSGLVYGIHSLSLPGTKNFKVTNSVFTNNDCGIYALNVDNADIRYNEFTIPKVGERTTGLYLDHCNGYIVEENDFSPGEVATSLTSRGIYVNESGPYDNTLYLNEFNNLAYGIVAEGCNRSSGGSAGLQIKCNTFTNTVNDISVFPVVLGYTIGVAKDQGIAMPKLCEQLAGNLFTQSSVNEYHFYNGPSDIVNYHYLGSNLNMQPRHILRVVSNPVNPLYGGDCCPPNDYGSGGASSIDQHTLGYRDDYWITKTELDSLIDQGVTDEKLFSLSTALPEEGLILTSDLLRTSPYISDTVIKKSIEREDVITNSMLRDVMIANPHTAKSHEILNFIETRIDPMPEYMVDEIMEGQFVQSEREQKEAICNLNKRAYTYGLNRQLALLLSDSLISKADSVIKLLNWDGTFYSLLKKSWVQFENGNASLALTSLEELDSINLTNNQRIELNSQLGFMQWVIENPIFDSTQRGIWENFCNNVSHKVSSSALGMLLASGVSDYHEPYSVIDLTKVSDPIEIKGKGQVEKYLIVTPNPAKDYITVKYAVDNTSSSLIIFNEEGRLILKERIGNQKDEVTINTITFNPGIYLMVLMQENGPIESSKFVISK